MATTIFVNLPVHDVTRATAFYEALGFERNAMFSNDRASAMVLDGAVYVMLLDRAFYATFTPKEIVDPKRQTQALFALSLDTRAAVDAITAAAIAAGGREAHEAQDEGFMYSRAFEDLDGHGWGPFQMDVPTADAEAGA